METYPEQQKYPRLMPWYVHITGGWSFGFLFPWFLTCVQFFRRGRRKSAFAMMGVVVAAFAVVCSSGYFAKIPYPTLLLLVITASMILSLTAWLVQRFTFGAAPKRYVPDQWRSWVVPILVAVIFGATLSVIVGFVPLIGERIRMYQAQDILTKKLALWEAFRYIPYSLIFSLPVGIWWAGERKRFTSATVLSYFSGLLISYIILSLLSSLFYFLLSKGQLGSSIDLGLLGSYDRGWHTPFIYISEHDYSPYFFMPLLIGTVSRVGDFFKRSLLIYPALASTFIAYSFFSLPHWNYYQMLVVYEMFSTDPAVRSRAYNQAEVLLARFPNHESWPKIATMIADYRYRQGKQEMAMPLYARIVERYGNDKRWWKQAAFAEAALENTQAGQEEKKIFQLEMPPLGYEQYMTGNWMVLLRGLRYYESDKLSKADTLIRLKNISQEEDEIDLPTMPTLADLYDNAANLDYEVIFLPSDRDLIEKLIRAGFPVIQPIGDIFSLLTGVDPGRGSFLGATYQDVLQYLKKDDIEAVTDEGFFKQGALSDTEHESRLELLAATHIPFNFWQGEQIKDQARHIAIVFPKKKYPQVLTALGQDRNHLQATTEAILTTSIAVSAFNCGDIIQAASWARKSYDLAEDDLPLHIAHLANLMWQGRDRIIGSKLHLEQRFPALNKVDEFLADADIQSFLEIAQDRFNNDLQHNRLPWMIRQQYRYLLDISNPAERKILIELALSDVHHAPDNRRRWIDLAGLYEWDKNLTGMFAAYSGALEAGSWNNNLALKLVRLELEAKKFSQANALLERIDANSVKYNPDYYYCMAMITDSKNDIAAAAGYYEKAIEMRRYDRRYHLDYAALLDRQGVDADRVEKLRDWAARLTGDVSQRDI